MSISKRMLIAAAMLFTTVTGVNAQQAPDSARLMRTISVLADDSMEGRQVNTPGSVKAQAFLTAELTKRGVKPFSGPSYSAPFKFVARGSTDSVPGMNLVGIIPGSKHPNRFIFVTAHYDHLGKGNGDVFNGADDNASGTAAALEVASYFAAHKPQNSVIIALFDAEERGDRGSRAFVNSGLMPNVDSVIIDLNMDMVGRNVNNELYAAGTTPYPQLLPYVQAAASRSGVIKIKTGHDGNPGQQNWTNQSDHGAFHEKHIPYIYFGEEDHPDYHRPSDEVKGIMPGFYIAAVRTVVDIAKQVDAKPPARMAAPAK